MFTDGNKSERLNDSSLDLSLVMERALWEDLDNRGAAG